MYKFFTEGFYKVFEEVNILKQYEEMKNKINTTEENKQITESEEVSLNEIFEDDGVTLKVDLNSIQKPSTYYYTIDEYCEALIELKNRSNVVICQGENQNKKYKRVTIIENPEKEYEEPPQQATIELGFNNMISSGSKFIGENAFRGCTNLKSINIDKTEGYIAGAPWGAPESTEVIWGV